MAIIKNKDFLKPLIPNFGDLVRCGNFATVDYEDGKHRPTMFAFVFDEVNHIFTRQYKVHFTLVGLTECYGLVLTKEDNKYGRYCDFIAVERDITKPLSDIDMWKFEVDDIGVSLKSDNANGNIIYFGTSENDSVEIRQGIYDGLTSNTVYKPCNTRFRALMLESLKLGMPATETAEDRRSNKQTLCLPSPQDVTQVDDSEVDYGEVLKRYARMKFRDRTKEEVTVTAEVVYV
jgi:hypothetical protein